MKSAEAAIIDATLITSAARPNGHVESAPEDRKEEDAAPDPPEVKFSADPDATWIRKGRKSMLG